MTKRSVPMWCLTLVLAALLACGAGLAPAQASAPPPQALAWDALDPTDRIALQPWAQDWDRLPDALRIRLQHNAARWRALTPKQQAALQERLVAWDSITPQQRVRLRARYDALQDMPPDERDDVHRAFERFKALPRARQASLRKRFAALPAEQRSAFLLDAGNRDTIDVARRYFAFVPPDERDATLAMLRGLDAPTRQALRQLAGRLGAEQREVLRRDLLAATPDARAALIRARQR